MNAIESLPAVVDLLPHRGEMLLLDRVLVVDEPGVTVLAHAGGQTWYADTSNTMHAWIGIELMAQAIAAHVGWRKAQRGLLPQRGVLLGTRAYHCDTHFFEGELEIDASASSQFLSALLLVAPSMRNGITVKHVGGTLPSMPHIEMTVQMLRDFGATVTVDSASNTWRVEPGALHGVDLVIEPDLSNAAPFISLAMVCGGSITISDWPQLTTQPGDQLRSILTAMGATVSMSDAGLTLKGSGTIHGIDINLHDVGELTPSIAALAALADSPSHLRGIGHLRLHETDRLAALTREINALGGNVVEEETALHITPAPLHAGVFHTYEDHRLATAGEIGRAHV